MKALIFQELVVQVDQNGFEVADPMVWIDCDLTVQPGWLYKNGAFEAPPQPTEEEKKFRCKQKASVKIAATDWAVLPDVNLQNKAEFETYRATLRDLIFNPVADPVWPVEPTPIPATQGA